MNQSSLSTLDAIAETQDVARCKLSAVDSREVGGFSGGDTFTSKKSVWNLSEICNEPCDGRIVMNSKPTNSWLHLQ